MTSPAGQWWVISVPTSARGSPKGEVSQKPFPAGAVVISGPYKTRAEAVAALAKGPAGQTGLPVPSIPNPFSWVGAVAHWIGDAVLHATDVHMWISIGWIVLGLWLVWMGVVLWLRLPEMAARVGLAAAKAA